LSDLLDIAAVREYLLGLQDRICAALEAAARPASRSAGGPLPACWTGDYRVVPEDRRQAELFPIQAEGE